MSGAPRLFMPAISSSERPKSASEKGVIVGSSTSAADEADDVSAAPI